jgi:hypothetical protein
MDVTRLASIAKFKVGDVVLVLRRPHRVTGRFWSAKRQHIVYDLERVSDSPTKSVLKKVGQGLLEPVPPTGVPEPDYYDMLPGDW